MMRRLPLARYYTDTRRICGFVSSPLVSGSGWGKLQAKPPNVVFSSSGNPNGVRSNYCFDGRENDVDNNKHQKSNGSL